MRVSEKRKEEGEVQTVGRRGEEGAIMTEFWLISVPLDKTSLQSLEKLKRAVSKARLASIFKFPIPELKMGNLDVLLSVSDDLTRLDTYAESVIRRVGQCLSEVMENSSDKVLENTLANGVDLASYVTSFQWDRAKYSNTLPLKTLTEVISKCCGFLASGRHGNHGCIVCPRGSLQTRPLMDVVKREDLVLDSEEDFAHWERTYESLTEFVVPRSSSAEMDGNHVVVSGAVSKGQTGHPGHIQHKDVDRSVKILEESEGGIFTVTLFKKSVSEFKAKAKQNKFTVREFSFEESEKQRQAMKRLSTDKKEQYGTFLRWLKVNFSEVFVAWIHLKALRVFVESVLRYGLPVNFQTVLLQPDRKRSKTLRELLNSLYLHLDGASAASKPDVGLDIPGVSMGQPEYFSYISYKIDINLAKI
ncbi:hypothetical protein JZ751_003226 [Albula glossodonta]|uniref:V-type proton ATPase subunit C n=1 Tax=Albula glossodonta TaxID=121402 RepID=A0A8T2NGU9_9TELE|nr:hypothetical protein JZ751_003226 [Albula glossodonta]